MAGAVRMLPVASAPAPAAVFRNVRRSMIFPTPALNHSVTPWNVCPRVSDDGRDRAVDGGRQEVQPLRPSGRNHDPDWLSPRLAGVRVVRSHGSFISHLF